MLFLTPPKLDGQGCPAQSPLLDIMDNVSSLLTQKEEADTILLDKELLRLLNGTPRTEPNTGTKQFIPRNSSRNITSSFSDVEAAPVFTPMDSEFKHDQIWNWPKPRKKSG